MVPFPIYCAAARIPALALLKPRSGAGLFERALRPAHDRKANLAAAYGCVQAKAKWPRRYTVQDPGSSRRSLRWLIDFWRKLCRHPT